MDWKPLILEWLKDARGSALLQAQKPNGSRYKLAALDKAIESIERNAETVEDVADLTKLPRVGEKTVAMLKQKIKKHCSHNSDTPLPMSMAPQPLLSSPSQPAKVLATEHSGQLYPFAPPPPPKKREYIPKYGSAPFHVLITMRLNEIDDPLAPGIGQSELQRLMKPRTAGVLDGAVSRPTPAVGMALKTLREHECVYLQNSRFFLDEPGRDLANRLILASGDPELTKKVQSHKDPNITGASAISTFENESETSSERSENGGTSYVVDEWPAGSFFVKLVIDNREVASKNDRTGLVNDLRTLGLDLDVQALSLGDCVWVAEHRRSGRRAVLDWILERKTLADLRASIHDGRYHDQKRRLARSTVPHVVYLIEYANNVANNEMFKENRKKFQTALSQTLVRSNFRLKMTRSQNETVQYIAKVTELLQKRYTDGALRVVVPNVAQFEASMSRARSDLVEHAVGIDFSAFHEALAKSKLRTIGETFRLMLRTIKGISPEKASAVQRVYPTPSHLRRAYLALNNEKDRRELVFKATQHHVRRQQLRLGLSEAIYDIWRTD